MLAQVRSKESHNSREDMVQGRIGILGQRSHTKGIQIVDGQGVHKVLRDTELATDLGEIGAAEVAAALKLRNQHL